MNPTEFFKILFSEHLRLRRTPMEDGELCLDDNTFEALKLLNGSLPNVPLRQARKLSNQIPEDKAFDLVKKMSLDDIHSAPQGPDSSHTKKSMAISRPKTAGGSKSSSSSARSETEKSTNVQLIFLTEALPKTDCSTSQDEKETRNQFKDNPKVLLVDNKTKEEALWFHQRMADYHASSPHYKDGKALAIVDRLANKILAEMIIDFQRDEMDQVVRTLYNLEFN